MNDSLWKAWQDVGGLTSTTKMPCFSYDIDCPRWRMNHLKGTVCERCYAKKGRYAFPKNRGILKSRARKTDKSSWIDSMVMLIKNQELIDPTKDGRFFRWHSCGELRNIQHFRKICAVAEKTPAVRHWLPTHWLGLREKRFGKIPSNLLVRFTCPVIDGRLGTMWSGMIRSSVFSKSPSGEGHVCPATTVRKACRECRSCWDKKVKLIEYRLH